MTIDEAIAHAREVAEEQKIKQRTCGNCKYCVKSELHPRQGYCYFNVIHYKYDLTQKACCNWESNDDIGIECAEEHEKLAEWLEELKFLRATKETMFREIYNQALEDFEKCAIQQSSYTETEEGWSGMTIDTKVIKSIKEQLKK